MTGFASNVLAGPLSGLNVILDGGHGGTDTGTARRYGRQRITESQLTWAAVMATKARLEVDGARVSVTTRWNSIAGLPDTVRFGQAILPGHGADAFNTFGQPTINGNRSGRIQRMNVVRSLWERDTTTEVVCLSIHFDHVLGGGRPGGTRIIYPSGIHDTLLVDCLATAFTADSLLRDAVHRPTVQNGRSGLGKHLLILRQFGEPISGRDGRWARPFYNPIHSVVLIELANLPNDVDWIRLQQPDTMDRYARAITSGLIQYLQQRNTPVQQ